MRPAYVLFGVFASTSLGQSFTPATFNVIEVLQEKGVNVSAIPDLLDLATRSSTARCSNACNILKLVYGVDRVITQGAPDYDAFTNSYWSSIQENLDPFCIVRPASAVDVSVAVLISRLTSCPFAARSGGHAAFGGASSIEAGITISFELMQVVTLSADNTTASVEPGNRWGDVYQRVSSTDFTVIGGRVSNIGIGGLTPATSMAGRATTSSPTMSSQPMAEKSMLAQLSIQIFTGLYEVVGVSVNRIQAVTVVDTDRLTDNFGLVVNFNLNTIPLPTQSMWGGTRVHTEENFAVVTRAFSNLVANSPTDPNAGHWVSWGSINGTKLAIPELYCATPDGGSAAIFDEYNAIPAVSNSTPKQSDGLREVYWGLTVKLNQTLADEAKDIFFEEIAAIADVEGVNPFMIYQGITTGQISAMSKNGGNPLGIKLSDGPLYLIHVSCMWENESDDSRVCAVISTVLTRLSARAKSLGKMNDYIYMNFASQFEDVISSYGADNKARLESIAEKYDPTGVFQTLQLGYFKLDHAPVPNSGYYSGV